MKKVFVLVSEWIIDCEDGMSCIGVYETLSQAQEKMRNDKKCTLEVAEFNEQMVEENDKNITIYEDGDYVCNHINWKIFEEEIQ